VTSAALDPLAWLILLPMFWATLAFVLGLGRGAWLAIIGIALQLGLALALAGRLLAGGVPVHPVGGWGAPLGIDLAVDGLAATMLLLTQAVALPLAVYARSYFTGDSSERRFFWPLVGFLLAAMNALFVSADLFNLYVTLELLGLAAVGLVAAGGKVGQTAAALRYLLSTLVGSGAYLLGVAMIYGAYGSVSLSTLAPLVDRQAPAAVHLAAGLMLVGLTVKTALFPFHFWLPPAHGGAPAPVSALLSALVVKASYYLILRLWLGILAPLLAPGAAIAWLAGLLGCGAILWGSFKAIGTPNLKMLVAYSTVAQIGYLFIVFPLLGRTSPGDAALQGSVLHAVAHALAKSAMFTAAGVLVKATGQETIDGLAGVATRLPLTLFAFALAGVTLMGLPPSAGFLAKWLLLGAAIGQGQWLLVAVIVAGGLLAAAYVFRVLRHAFLPAPVAVSSRPVPRMLEWVAFGLAASSVLLGLRGMEILRLLAAGGSS